jgi:hypothetical protein
MREYARPLEVGDDLNATTFDRGATSPGSDTSTP